MNIEARMHARCLHSSNFAAALKLFLLTPGISRKAVYSLVWSLPTNNSSTAIINFEVFFLNMQDIKLLSFISLLN